MADKWAKQDADKPDSHGVDLFRYQDRYGSKRMHYGPSSTSSVSSRKLFRLVYIRSYLVLGSKVDGRPSVDQQDHEQQISS